MTLTEAILYLADYIEEGRRFSDCVTLRNMFFDAAPEKMTQEARLVHLGAVIYRSLEMTVAELGERGAPVCLDTRAALRYFNENQKPF
jgi:HD superfamily phosphohydrolase YqeK